MSELKLIGALADRWLVVEVDGRRLLKVEAFAPTDEEVEEIDCCVDEAAQEGQEARDEKAQGYFDEMDLVDARREKKEKKQAAENAERIEVVLAAKPGTTESINRITETASRLNEMTDEATAYIEGVEARLEEVGYEIEVRGDQYDERIVVSNVVHALQGLYIEFAKTTGAHRKWCFVLVSNSGTSSQGFMPLIRAPRVSRILAVKHVPALLEKMRKRIAEDAKKVGEGER